MAPKTRYAPCGELNLAYQVVGEGDITIVLVPSFVSHIEMLWGHPAITSFLDHLTGFARLVIFDKAGTGLSDPVAGIPTLEQRADEVEAVMDAAGVEQAAIFGLSEGGPSAIFFSVTRPGRASALVLFGSYSKGLLDVLSDEPSDLEQARRRFPDEEDPLDESLMERWDRFRHGVMEEWGEGKALKALLPNQGDESQLGMFERLAASPGMARATLISASGLDVTDLLPSVAVPTLVVHAKEDMIPIQAARLMARSIPGARLVEVEGVDHAPWFSSPDAIAGEIEELLTGARHAREPDRVLATVLFTDIVSSTERASELGDAGWRAILARHDDTTRRRVAEFGGSVIKSTGDGFLATFAGPAAGIRCAEAIRDSLTAEGIEIRAGLHTGEIERMGEDVGGMGVHIAARVCAKAGASEILVSRTITDLVVGSGLAFEPRGSEELKGVPGEWQLFAVAAERSPAERRLAEIEIGKPRESQRSTDRLAAAVARRSPGAIRAAFRLDPRYRRARKAAD